MVKHLSTMRETWVQSLSREDPLEKEMAIHSSAIAWKIPRTEARLQSMGSQRVGHNWATPSFLPCCDLISGSSAFSKSSLYIQRSNCQQPLNHRKCKGIPEKNICFCFIDYIKAFDCVDHNKLQTILQEMEIPDHLTCLPRNLYAGQEES